MNNVTGTQIMSSWLKLADSYDSDDSLSGYASKTWSLQAGQTTADVGTGLNYSTSANDTLTYKETSKKGNADSGTVTNTTNSEFHGSLGEVLVGQTTESYSMGKAESSAFSTKFTYTDNSAGQKATVNYDGSESESITSSLKDNDTSYSESSSSSGSSKNQLDYSDALGYKLAYKISTSSKESSSTSENFKTGAYTETYSYTATKTISDFSYSDASGNSFKLSASSTAKANDEGDVTTSAQIASMKLATGNFNISASKIALPSAKAMDDLLVLVGKAGPNGEFGTNTNAVAVTSIFSTVYSSLLDAILPGGNTINISGTTDGISVNGGAGNDTIKGNTGADKIKGGTGADKLTGGAGADKFIFDNIASSGADTISDFTEDDTLVFDTTVFTQLAGATAADGKTFGSVSDYLRYESRTGVLSYDADGAGETAAIKIVTLTGTGKATLDFSDLEFI